jgi:hypothetical protein
VRQGHAVHLHRATRGIRCITVISVRNYDGPAARRNEKTTYSYCIMVKSEPEFASVAMSGSVTASMCTGLSWHRPLSAAECCT